VSFINKLSKGKGGLERIIINYLSHTPKTYERMRKKK
jgi:hypothetical protein